jgi:hypothetical protein
MLNSKKESNNFKIKRRSNKLKYPGTFNIPLRDR